MTTSACSLRQCPAPSRSLPLSIHFSLWHKPRRKEEKMTRHMTWWCFRAPVCPAATTKIFFFEHELDTKRYNSTKGGAFIRGCTHTMLRSTRPRPRDPHALGGARFPHQRDEYGRALTERHKNLATLANWTNTRTGSPMSQP